MESKATSTCSRRAFVGLLASCAVCAGVGGVAQGIGPKEGLLRPPGAQDSAAFLAACVKCDRCRSVCPQGCVSVGTVSDSLLDARTPVLDMHRGYCDFCDKCYEVCPTGAIEPFDPATDRIGVAIVQSDRCIAYFNGCTECYQRCPYGAITLDAGDHPIVDPQACNGCGLCENICPALVYRSFSGGSRRGIVVVTPERYQELGTTTVDGGGE